MRTRRFGRTGIQISELIFGAGWVGGILIHQDDDVKRKAIRLAIDGGINWIDTANDYGQGQSELALGWLLSELEPSERPHLSTKFRLDLMSGESFESQIKRMLEQSLSRLRVDRVPLYQLHNPVLADRSGQHVGVNDVLEDGGIVDILENLKSQGYFDHIGFTAFGDTASCINVVESGRVDSAQVYFNMLNPTAALDEKGVLQVQDFSGLIAACKEQDVGVMNIRVFAAGILATDERHGREIPITTESDLDEEAARAASVFKSVGDEHGTRAQRAIRFSLAEKRVSGVVIGLAEIRHLKEALKAAELGPLPPTELEDLRKVWSRNFDL